MLDSGLTATTVYAAVAISTIGNILRLLYRDGSDVATKHYWVEKTHRKIGENHYLDLSTATMRYIMSAGIVVVVVSQSMLLFGDGYVAAVSGLVSLVIFVALDFAGEFIFSRFIYGWR